MYVGNVVSEKIGFIKRYMRKNWTEVRGVIIVILAMYLYVAEFMLLGKVAAVGFNRVRPGATDTQKAMFNIVIALFSYVIGSSVVGKGILAGNIYLADKAVPEQYPGTVKLQVVK